MRGAGIIFILLLLCALTNSTKTHLGNSDAVPIIGCNDGTADAFLAHPFLVACSGTWIGHVRNASHLCAKGWHVCSHRDKDRLKRVSWLEAVSLNGCFAFNAAQDGGTCQECRSNLEMDDMAGIGRACPHQNFGETSCISGGRIDVTCCVDTRLGTACSYRPGLASGVICCKDQDFPPKLILTPPLTVQVTKGSNMSLTCGVSGNPNPVVLWYKDGISLLNTNKRIFTFRTGTLIVSDVRSVDSGRYRCFAKNNFGNVTTTTQVTVIEPNFGCADRSDQGLFFLPNISACKGAWTGHIRRAKNLCSRGWRVCGTHDVRSLRRLSWQQATNLDGCYAYNAAVSKGKCVRCHDKNMAGIGHDCSYMFHHGASCLKYGRIDVYSSEQDKFGCFYHKNITTGVMCCRIHRSHSIRRNGAGRRSLCKLPCQNKGICIGRNKCQCSFGYTGLQCDFPICKPPCGTNQICTSPGKCQCTSGFTGKRCEHQRCPSTCHNGGRCKNGRCHCGRHHWGSSCQYDRSLKHYQDLNRTER